MSKRVTKLFTTKASSIDEEKRSVTFVISTNQQDRYGEIVDQKSWDFKSYKQNPLVLWGHDPDQPENVLGTGGNLTVAEDGSRTTAELTFDSDINPKAGLVFEQIKRGTLRTVSVGFMNHTYNTEDDVPVLKDNELLEISVVPNPRQPGRHRPGAEVRGDQPQRRQMAHGQHAPRGRLDGRAIQIKRKEGEVYDP
jgi:HK97 family phage prohead protease